MWTICHNSPLQYAPPNPMAHPVGGPAGLLPRHNSMVMTYPSILTLSNHYAHHREHAYSLLGCFRSFPSKLAISPPTNCPANVIAHPGGHFGRRSCGSACEAYARDVYNSGSQMLDACKSGELVHCKCNCYKPGSNTSPLDTAVEL